jgi:peptidoglycan/LPS O-acetylase OafA/YrhL
MTKPSAYIPGLDGIRAIAFLMVFWAHALPPVAYYIPATLGVTVFFFLSGYLITTLLRRELHATGTIALKSFYLRRALRIIVPLYVVYALAAAFAHFIEHASAGNWAGLFSTLFYCYNYTTVLFVHAWVPVGLNVIWSLSVEEHFYILFPLLYIALYRSRLTRAAKTRLLVGFCLLELLWRVVLVTVFHDRTLWTYFATDARLDSILWGCILALNNNPVFFADSDKNCHPERSLATPPMSCHPERSEGPASGTGGEPQTDTSILPRNHQLLAFLFGIALLIASLLPRSFLYKESLRYTLQALALYLIFSFIVANIRHPLVAWLEWRPLRYLGWISYVLYLSHDFILDALTLIWPDRFLLTGPLAFLIAIAFATLLRYTLELPLQRLRSRLRPAPAV